MEIDVRGAIRCLRRYNPKFIRTQVNQEIALKVIKILNFTGGNGGYLQSNHLLFAKVRSLYLCTLNILMM